MPRWMRIARGMIGTGLGFGALVGTLVGGFTTVRWLAGDIPFVTILRATGKASVVFFILGVIFSGVLAVVARGRSFSKLSLPYVTGLGSGAGLLYWIFLAMNGGRNWAPNVALLNFLVLTVGVGTAAGITLLIARRGQTSVAPSDEVQMLEQGDEPMEPVRTAAQEEPRSRR